MAEEQVKEQVKVYFDFVSNPRAARSGGWVALIVGDEIQFVKASIPEYSKGLLVGGTYMLPKGAYVIVKHDRSSHKNGRQYYTLYKVEGGQEGIKELASIDVINNNLTFSPKELEDIYVSSPPGVKSRIIYALVQYSKKHMEAAKNE